MTTCIFNYFSDFATYFICLVNNAYWLSLNKSLLVLCFPQSNGDTMMYVDDFLLRMYDKKKSESGIPPVVHNELILT